jgi:hypothetical protein
VQHVVFLQSTVRAQQHAQSIRAVHRGSAGVSVCRHAVGAGEYTSILHLVRGLAYVEGETVLFVSFPNTCVSAGSMGQCSGACTYTSNLQPPSCWRAVCDTSTCIPWTLIVPFLLMNLYLCCCRCCCCCCCCCRVLHRLCWCHQGQRAPRQRRQLQGSNSSSMLGGAATARSIWAAGARSVRRCSSSSNVRYRIWRVWAAGACTVGCHSSTSSSRSNVLCRIWRLSAACVLTSAQLLQQQPAAAEGVWCLQCLQPAAALASEEQVWDGGGSCSPAAVRHCCSCC